MRFDIPPLVLSLPALSDEAAAVLLDSFHQFVDAFESCYFAKIHRYYQNQRRECCEFQQHCNQLDLFPDTDDPPF